MLKTRQDEAKTRAQLLRQELGETLDHAVKAAGHAAVGVRAAGTRMAPAAGRVKDVASQRWEATVAAFNDTTGMSAADVRTMRRARRQQPERLPIMVRGTRGRRKGRRGRRLPRLVGMLAAGMAAGAATAMVLRRRRQQWDEYDATEALEAVGAAEPAPGAEPAGGPVGVTESGPLGESAPEPEAMGQAEPIEPQADVYRSGEAGPESTDDLVGRARRSSRNAQR